MNAATITPSAPFYFPLGCQPALKRRPCLHTMPGAMMMDGGISVLPEVYGVNHA